MTLREIKKTIMTLNSWQLVKLDAWLHELVEAAEAKRIAGGSTGRQVLEELRAVNKTYRLEEVRCGKKNCRCSRGELHGPYWYAYWTEGGKTQSEYVGKELPGKRKKSVARGVR